MLNVMGNNRWRAFGRDDAEKKKKRIKKSK